MDPDLEPIVNSLSDRFWDVVHAAKNDWARFEGMLAALDNDAVWKLYWTYRAALSVLLNPEYAEHADPRLVEDGLDDLASWIVAQGRTYYMDVVTHPEHMPLDTPENGFPRGRPLSAISQALGSRFDSPEDDTFYFA